MFSYFIFSYSKLQRVTLKTRKGVLSSICQVKRMSVLVYVPQIRFKITRVVYAANHEVIGGRCSVCFLGCDTNVNLRYAGHQWICVWCLILLHGLINHQEPQITRSEASLQSYEPQRTAVAHIGESNQQKSPSEFKKPARPMFHSCCVH